MLSKDFSVNEVRILLCSSFVGSKFKLRWQLARLGEVWKDSYLYVRDYGCFLKHEEVDCIILTWFCSLSSWALNSAFEKINLLWVQWSPGYHFSSLEADVSLEHAALEDPPNIRRNEMWNEQGMLAPLLNDALWSKRCFPFSTMCFRTVCNSLLQFSPQISHISANSELDCHYLHRCALIPTRLVSWRGDIWTIDADFLNLEDKTQHSAENVGEEPGALGSSCISVAN